MSSAYPGALDAFLTNRLSGDTIQAATDNDHSDAINKIEAQLGIDPSGIHSTVKARLDSVDTELGTDPSGIYSTVKARLDNVDTEIGADETRLDSIETELGTNPSGTYSTVKDRLDAVSTPYFIVPSPSGGDDRTAIQAIIDLAEVAGGTVFFRAGIYLISSPGLVVDSPYVNLIGMGRDATILKKTAICDLLTFRGPVTLTHNKRMSLKNMTLHGGDTFTGALLKLVYIGEFVCEDVYFWGNPDTALQAAEIWDSFFDRCITVWCSGADGTKPAWNIRNSMAASGYGFSGDNSNMLRFRGCHWESFKDGAVWIKAGVSNTNNPNGIWFDHCKFETIMARGPYLDLDGFGRNIRIQNSYFSLGGLDSGFAGPLPYILGWLGAGECSLRDTQFHQWAGAYQRFIEWWPSGGPNTWDTVTFKATTAPTVACIKFSGGTSIELARRNIRSTTGHTLTNGTIPPVPTDF